MKQTVRKRTPLKKSRLKVKPKSRSTNLLVRFKRIKQAQKFVLIGLALCLVIVGFNYKTITRYARDLGAFGLGSTPYPENNSALPVYYYTTGSTDLTKDPSNGTYYLGGQIANQINGTSAPQSFPDAEITNKNINNYSIPVTTTSVSPTVPLDADGDSVPGEKLTGLKDKAVRSCWWIRDDTEVMPGQGQSSFELSIINRGANNQPIVLKKQTFSNITSLGADVGFGKYRKICVQTDVLSASSMPGVQYNLKLTSGKISVWRVSREITGNFTGEPAPVSTRFTGSYYDYGDINSEKITLKTTNVFSNTVSSPQFSFSMQFVDMATQDTEWYSKYIRIYRDSSDGKVKFNYSEYPATLKTGPNSVVTSENCYGGSCRKSYEGVINYAFKDGVAYDFEAKKAVNGEAENWEINVTDSAAAKTFLIASGALGRKGQYQIAPDSQISYSDRLKKPSGDVVRDCAAYPWSSVEFSKYMINGKQVLTPSHNSQTSSGGYCPGLSSFSDGTIYNGIVLLRSGFPVASRDTIKPVVTIKNVTENQVVSGNNLQINVGIVEASQIGTAVVAIDGKVYGFYPYTLGPNNKNPTITFSSTENYGVTPVVPYTNGVHVLTVQVIDSFGNIGESAPVKINISN